jgi:type I restriction enzyme S subunit
VWNNVRESQTLAALRDLLLPKLMSGEIRIADAETLVGQAA